MRVVLVHNHYGSDAPSGENQVFAMERSLLEARGHEVELFARYSDEIRRGGLYGKVHGAMCTPWNTVSAKKMRRVVDEFRPQVIHAHNTFPLISPSVFPAAKGAARVLTLHNYRLFCPAGIPMRNGTPCLECLSRKSVVPSLRYGCYRNSRLATMPLAINVALHRAMGTWERDVDAFIALSSFQKELMTDGGLPGERIMVKPNFYPGSPPIVNWECRKSQVVFVGRLGEEKGLHDLISGWLAWGAQAPDLVLVGDGSLRTSLEARVAAARVGNVRFLGQLDSEAAQRVIAESKVLVLPSLCFEGFPMVLREAFAFGTPVLVSDRGPLPDLVRHGNGAVFVAGNPADLREKAEALWDDEDRLTKMSAAARALFESAYTEEANYKMLMEIYQIAMDRAGVTVEEET